MRKKGMTMIMLVIYILVLLVLFGISITTILDSDEIGNVTEESFKAIITKYVEEFNTIKDYYNIKNEEFPNILIEGNELVEYIPSISLEHTEYIVIENREIKYNTVIVADYQEKEYLEQLFNEGIIGKYTP